MITRFERHYDNIGEVIAAQHVNELQDVININEQNILLLKDVDFENYALWVLEHSPEYKRLWVDTFGDTSRIDSSKSLGVIFMPQERLVRVRQDQVYGELYSVEYVDAEVPISQVLLLATISRPVTDDHVIFEINVNGAGWQPIERGVPFTPTVPGDRFQLRAKMTRSSDYGPSLYRWALLWG